MTLDKGKHIVEEINGIRCTVVEKGATEERVAFLKDILELNGFEVQVQEDKRETEEAPVTYTLGVTDLVFNPVIAVYEMSLKTRDGQPVTMPYWNRWTTKTDTRYWAFRAKRDGAG
jgi:hypothetical protein